MNTTKDNIPYLDLKAQYRGIRGEILQALEDVCESAAFAQGPLTLQFEKDFAAYCEVKHCVTLNSGTSALHLALKCLNVGPGDEVITTPFTFIATAWAISYVGATPVFVDIEPGRRALDPEKIEAAITPRTKAILPVHLFGMPADMDAISSIADRHGIPIVEDACQAHGARYKGRRVGGIGKVGCFSFYPTKNLGAYGEGGALTTNDDAIAERARSLRNHAQSKRYHHDEIGYNYRMDSFQAAVLNVKLKYLDQWNAARTRVAALYSQLLADSPVKLPRTFADSECVWHCYVVESDDRDQLRRRLEDAGIGTAVNYPVPLNRQLPYQQLRAEVPEVERLAERCLSLPIFPEISSSDIRTVTSIVEDRRA